ncbi:MAG: rhodanese-like domain-containing protein, partial [Cellulophaga sp.]|nr:rhodanese-like domain-containing protein [Cellulophaga sp.]
LKIVCCIGEVLSGKLVTFHALSLKQGVYNFKRNPSISIKSLEDDYLSLCGVPKAMEEISFQEYLAQPLNFNLLDVRTETERSESAYIRSIHIPLNELAHRCQELPINKNLLVFCKSGVRSKLAIEILEKQGFAKQLVNLKGGYN